MLVAAWALGQCGPREHGLAMPVSRITSHPSPTLLLPGPRDNLPEKTRRFAIFACWRATFRFSTNPDLSITGRLMTRNSVTDRVERAGKDDPS